MFSLLFNVSQVIKHALISANWLKATAASAGN
jgi:hypothetical protein